MSNQKHPLVPHKINQILEDPTYFESHINLLKLRVFAIFYIIWKIDNSSLICYKVYKNMKIVR